MSSSNDVPVIRALEESVVNRIAAGEVIHRPSNALKELLENSLDAGSSRINVQLKDGGLKLLQVTDNGHGIRVEDFPILCQRFTTSKLNAYEDLSRIQTFGFRGEALASITHVAHVTITSMTAYSDCAYKASFSDGVLVPPFGTNPQPATSDASSTATSSSSSSSTTVIAENCQPKPCAGVKGTQITAEDLFYNVPIRRQAFKNYSEEYARCLDVMTRYAIHFSGVSFCCKKAGSNKPDLLTNVGAKKIDNIKALYGSAIAKELLPFNESTGPPVKSMKPLTNTNSSTTMEPFSCQVSGFVTNANYHTKKLTFILFINNRLVESNSIKKVIENLFSNVLPKHTHPFVYLSLELPSHNVDVNVHPTKKEVHFLQEEAVLSFIENSIEKVLYGANSSRVFQTQSLKNTMSATLSVEYAQNNPLTLTHNDNNSSSSLSSSSSPPSRWEPPQVVEPLSTGEEEEDQEGDPGKSTNMEDNVDADDTAPNDQRDTARSTSFPTSTQHSGHPFRLKQLTFTSQSQSQSQPQQSQSQSGVVNLSLAGKSALASRVSRRDDKLVRTDNSQVKLELFLQPSQKSSMSQSSQSSSSLRPPPENSGALSEADVNDDDDSLPNKRSRLESSSSASNGSKTLLRRPPIQLTSIHNLCSDVVRHGHRGLAELLHQHIVVGSVDDRYTLVQHKTRLYMLDMLSLSQHFFYQTILQEFGTFPIQRLQHAAPIQPLVRMALSHPRSQWKEADGDKEELSAAITELLVSRADMLKEYFSIDISEDGKVQGLPQLLKGYLPPMLMLPFFLLKLGNECVWDEEQPCLDSICHQLSLFYRIQPGCYLSSSGSTESSSNDKNAKNSLQWQLHHLLLPAMKNHFLPPIKCVSDGTVTQLACLENLYKVFERC